MTQLSVRTESRLVDAQGNPIQLRGVVVTGLEQSPSYVRPDTYEDFQHALGLGCNVIHIKIGCHLWLADSKYHDPGYRWRVAERVRWATEGGAYVVLQQARSQRGDRRRLPRGADWDSHPDGVPLLDVMADDRVLQCWKEVADVYGNHPQVLFDLYNEPHAWDLDMDWGLWAWGGIGKERNRYGFWPRQVEWRIVGMVELYDAVRARAPHAPIIVSGTNWATNLAVFDSMWPANRPCIRGVHCYNDAHKGGDGSVAPNLDLVVDHAQRWPVFCTEFGHDGPRAYDYMADTIAAFDGAGLSWVAYSWATGDIFSLIASRTPHYQLTAAGLAVGQSFDA